MNTACFDKTMESVCKRRNEDLVVSNTYKAEGLIDKPQFETFRIINDSTVMIDRVKMEVLLKKPIYAGFCILEQSKVLMADFHYNVILERYDVNNARLLFSNTDSLVYHITTDNLNKDFGEMREHFDFSDYPCNHPLYSLKMPKP